MPDRDATSDFDGVWNDTIESNFWSCGQIRTSLITTIDMLWTVFYSSDLNAWLTFSMYISLFLCEAFILFFSKCILFSQQERLAVGFLLPPLCFPGYWSLQSFSNSQFNHLHFISSHIMHLNEKSWPHVQLQSVTPLYSKSQTAFTFLCCMIFTLSAVDSDTLWDVSAASFQTASEL